MKFYKGPKPGDEKPIGGGRFTKLGIGGEAHNFLNINGVMYGYFQPHMKSPYEINLSRIKQGCPDDADKIDNVLVIWFATHPIDRGQVVIGWYNNATVYRYRQEPNNMPLRNNGGYYIKANVEDCVLLPISNRRFPVGHETEKTRAGNPGTANIFYVLDSQGEVKDLTNENNEWIANLVNYVEDYNGHKILTEADEIEEDIKTGQYSPTGQGFQSDVMIRMMIESYAMAACKKYYSDKGYKVVDDSAKSSYDFIIHKKNEVSRLVEVKGTQTVGNTIILTKNEVCLSREQGENMVLFIVHSIVMNKNAVKKGSGYITIHEPWIVNDDRLTPISYTYKLSE